MSDIDWDSGCNITIPSHSPIYIFFILGSVWSKNKNLDRIYGIYKVLKINNYYGHSLILMPMPKKGEL
jgi:hypothetical protein